MLLLSLMINLNCGLEQAQAQSKMPFSEDPYIDPEAVRAVLEPQQRFNADQGLMLGLVYGLNPTIVFAPALSIAYYFDPLVTGMEISDSDKISIWAKQRNDGLGPSRFLGTTVFAKLFVGYSFYVIGAYEDRSIYFWDRTYDRPPEGGKARFDMFFKSSLASLGIGYMRYGKFGFMSLDILRYSILLKQSVRVEEQWETWSSLGKRAELDANIRSKRNDWFDTLDSPSAMLITVGLFF